MLRKSSKLKCTKAGRSGSAIVETMAGLFILIPVFLLLIDIIALVIAQSVNDDLAKQAARYAAQVPVPSTAYVNGSVNPQVMQPLAQAAAQKYLDNNCGNYTGNNGLICQAEIVSCTFDPVNGIQVTTQIRCDLPIAVPLGGPSFTTFRAQFTEAPVDVQPTATGS